MNVLFVCLGNICRSPIAEGILKQLFKSKGLGGLVESAGFESFHINDAPDPRAVSVSAGHGIDISQKRARLFSVDDFDRFDRIYVMDLHNMNDVMSVARNDADRQKVDYLLNLVEPGSNKSVPDPWYSGLDACENTFQMMWQACENLIGEIKATEDEA